MYLYRVNAKYIVVDDTKRPKRATELDMTKFHSDDYIQFLRLVSPDNMNDYTKQLQRCMYLLISNKNYSYGKTSSLPITCS